MPFIPVYILHLYMMNKTFTADDGSEGNITLQEYKGQYYPPDSFQKKHYDRLKTFDVDATDVIICSYPKSGSNM